MSSELLMNLVTTVLVVVGILIMYVGADMVAEGLESVEATKADPVGKRPSVMLVLIGLVIVVADAVAVYWLLKGAVC